MAEVKMITETEAKLSAHEQLCLERYNNIDKSLRDGDKRMTKIEYLLYGVILTAAVLLVITIIWCFLVIILFWP